MNIVAYKVVYGPICEMNTVITERMKEGWQPWGNPQLVVKKDKDCVMQVMVKYGTKV